MEVLEKHKVQAYSFDLIRQVATEFDLTSSCIYFLVHESVVVYVGQTKALGQRLVSHKKEKEFDRAFYLNVPAQVLSEVEAAFIRVLKPKYNAVGVQNIRDSDIEIVRQYGLASLLNSKPEKYGCIVEEGDWGPVIISDGEHRDKIGYYDDDDSDCECGAWDEIAAEDLDSIDPDDIDCTCLSRPIVYFEKWSQGYHVFPRDMVRKLPSDLEREARADLLERQFKDVPKEVLGALGIEL
jgi:hypothetical protein